MTFGSKIGVATLLALIYLAAGPPAARAQERPAEEPKKLQSGVRAQGYHFIA